MGAASFALSYVALRDVAADVGAVPGYLAWLVPVVIDGGIICGSAVIWADSYRAERRQVFPFLFIAVLVVMSVVVNVNHAGPSLLAKTIAALPPLVLLGTLELVAAQHRRAATPPAPTARAEGGHATTSDSPAGDAEVGERPPPDETPAPKTSPAKRTTTKSAATKSAPRKKAPAKKPAAKKAAPTAPAPVEPSREDEVVEPAEARVSAPTAVVPAAASTRRRTARVVADPPAPNPVLDGPGEETDAA